MERCGVAYTALIALAVSTTGALAAETVSPKAVIELFTSQGCSSCPTADRLLGELTRDSSLVAMSLPIDYWDYLGWKDTLAKPAHSARQRSYAHMRGDRDVYTPQVVVNGMLHALGSDKAAIEDAIAQSRQKPATMSVPVKLAVSNDKVQVSIAASAAKLAAEAEAWLCPLSKRVAVAIGRGENSGRTVAYHNVVRNWIKLGDWNGSGNTWTMPTKDFKSAGVDEVAVILQSGTPERPGVMLGAAIATIR